MTSPFTGPLRDPQDERAIRALQSWPQPDPLRQQESIYDAVIQRRVAQENDQLTRAVRHAVTTDPDLAGEVQRMGVDLDLAPEVVARNVDKVRRLYALKYEKARALANGDTVLTRMLADPRFAAIAHDETDKLSWFERVSKQWEAGGLEFERGLLGEQMRMGRLTDPNQQARLAWTGQRLQELPASGGITAGWARVLGQQYRALPKVLEVGLAAAAAAGATAFAAGQAGPQMALPEEALTVPAAMWQGFQWGSLGAMAMQAAQTEGGNAYVDMVTSTAEGGLGYSHEQAARVAGVVGAANALLEVAGGFALAKGAGIALDPIRKALRVDITKGAVDALTRPTLGAAARQFAKGYGTGLGGEVLTEVAQEGVTIAGEEIARWLQQDPTLESTVTRQQVVQRLLDTAVQTAEGMALLAAPGPVMNLHHQSMRIAAAERNAKAFERVVGVASELKLGTRDAEQLGKFVSDVAEKHGAPTVYADGLQVAQMLAQADAEHTKDAVQPAIESLRAVLPDLARQVEEAVRAGGGDVVVSYSDYMTHLARLDLGRALLPHLRIGDPEAPTVAETESHRKLAAELAEQAATVTEQKEAEDSAFNESAARVGAELQTRIHAAASSRFTAQQVREGANFVRDFIVVQAAKEQKTPEQYFAEHPYVIQSVGTSDPAGRSALSQSEQLKTDTPEFKEWFGESKIVDAQGKPKVMFHGSTTEGVVELTPSAGVEVAGATFFSDREDVAEQYRFEREYGEIVGDQPGDLVQAYLSVRNPLVVDMGGRVGGAATVSWLVREAKAAGHDGLVLENVDDTVDSSGMRGTTVAVFSPEQIKSVDNRGTFDPRTANIFHQEPAAERDLVAVHNLTAGNLVEAARLGGLPVPSIAISKVDAPLENFGGISLIGTRGMIDPANTPVFDADAYTPRFPELHWAKVPAKRADAFIKQFQTEIAETESVGESAQLYEALTQKPDARRAAQDLAQSAFGRLAFLRTQQSDYAVPRRAGGVAHAISQDVDLHEFLTRNAKELQHAPYDTWYGSALERALTERVKIAVDTLYDFPDRPDILKRMRANYLDAEGRTSFGKAQSLLLDLPRVGKTEVDTRALSDAIADKRQELDAWAAAQVGSVFDAPRMRLGRRLVPLTLDNVVAAMTSRKLRGQEDTMTFGAGNARAAMSAKFRSIDDVKRARERIAGSSAQLKEARDNVDRVLEHYRALVIDRFKDASDTWEAMDSSMRALAALGKKTNPDLADASAALHANGFPSVNDERTLQVTLDAMRALRGALVEYFEAKPQRAVMLDEFRGAVIPEGSTEEVRRVLRDAGLEVVEYSPGHRPEAVSALARQLDATRGDVLFQNEGFYSALARGLEGVSAKAQGADGWRATIKGLVAKGVVKAEELEWVGVDEWLELQKGKITKDALLAVVRANGVRVEVTSLSGDDVRYASYQTPGGTNYREVLLTLPSPLPSPLTSPALLDLAVNGYNASTPEQQARLDKIAVKTTGSFTFLAGARSNAVVAEEFAEVDAPWVKEWIAATKAAIAKDTIDFRSPHWGEPNVLAHVRLNDRVDAEGKRVLFVEELQSDWAQKGRDEGFRTAPADRARFERAQARVDELRNQIANRLQELEAAGMPSAGDVLRARGEFQRGGRDPQAPTSDGLATRRQDTLAADATYQELLREQRAAVDEWNTAGDALREDQKGERKAPAAPFVTSTDAWITLALKKVLQIAVNEGYDRVALVNGQQSADRYDLSKHISSLRYNPYSRNFAAYALNGNRVIDEDNVAPEDLHRYVGDELAAKILEGVEKRAAERTKWRIVPVRDHYELRDDFGRRVFSGYDNDGNEIPATYDTEADAKQWIDDLYFSDHEEVGTVRLHGLDLKVGGEGMKAFYDKIVPGNVNRLLKKLGGGVLNRVGISTTPAITRLDYRPALESEIGHPFDAEPTWVVAAYDSSGGPALWQEFLTQDQLQEQLSPAIAASIATYQRDTGGRRWRTLDVAPTHAKSDLLTQPAFDVTDALRQSVERGLPLFHEGDAAHRGAFDPESLTTLLYQKADFSTFLHETGHYFMTVLFRAAAAPSASESTRKDVQTLLDWFGVKDLDAWNSLSFEQQRKHHERWAYSYERFLFEETPAAEPAMEWVYRLFTTWLRAVYRTITNHPAVVYRQKFSEELPILTGEVRDVMERLVQSETAVNVARATRSTAALFTTKDEFVAAGHAEAAWAGYETAVKDADEAAVMDLTRASLRQMQWLRGARSRVLKRLQREHKALRAEIRDEVAAELRSTPVERARRWLRTGEHIGPDGLTAQEERDTQHKLDRASVQALALGGLDTEKIDRLMTDSGGVPPALAAQLFGFDDPADLVRALITEPAFDDAVDARTDARMVDEHADFVEGTPEHDAAVDLAMHNDARARLAAVEFNFLDNATRPTRLLTAAAKSAATAMMGSKRVGDFRPSGRAVKPLAYRASVNERRAAARAVRAMRAGEHAEARQAKRQQLLEGQIAKIASEVREEIDDALSSFKRFSTPDSKAAKTRDVDLLAAGRALLAMFELGTSDRPASDFVAQLQAYDPYFYGEVVAPLLERYRDTAKNWRELTLDEFRELTAVLDGLWHKSKTAHQITVDGEQVALDAVQAEFGARFAALGVPAPGTLPGEASKVQTKSFVARWANSMKALLRRVEHWADTMDDPNGHRPFTRYIWRPVKRAVNNYRERRNTYLKRYVRLLEAIGPIPDATYRADPANEFDYTFTFPELLGALLHTGNASNFTKFLVGRGWGEMVGPEGERTLDASRWNTFLARMIREGHVRKEHFEWAQQVWDTLEDLKPTLQRAHHAVYGFYFKEVKAAPFTIAFPDGQTVTYRGGYVPAKVDQFMVRDAQQHAKLEDLARDFRQVVPSVSSGAFQTRVEGYRRPLSLDVRLIARHLEEVIRFAHVQPAVSDVLRVIGDDRFATPLTRMDANAIEGMLKPWLQRAASQSTHVQGWLDPFWRYVRRNSGMAALTLHLSNALQQVTGLSLSALKVRPGALRSAFWTWFTGFRVVDGGLQNVVSLHVAQASKAMADRMENQMFDLTDRLDELLTNPGAFNKLRAWSNRHAYVLQRGFQNMVDIVTWTAANNEALADGATEAEAVERADAVVRLTQSSLEPEDVAAYQASSEFIKVVTQFSGYFNTLANLNVDEYTTILRESGWRGGWPKLVTTYLLGFALPMLLSDAIARTFANSWDDDDDDGYMDEFAEWFFGGHVRGLSALIPGVGPAAGQIVTSAFTESPYDDRMTTAPAIRVLESATVGVVRAFKAAANGEVTGRGIKDFALLLSTLLGTPAPTVAARPLSYWRDTERAGPGSLDPTGPVDFVRGLVTGQPGEAARR